MIEDYTPTYSTDISSKRGYVFRWTLWETFPEINRKIFIKSGLALSYKSAENKLVTAQKEDESDYRLYLEERNHR
jgi:hypothetical protein